MSSAEWKSAASNALQISAVISVCWLHKGWKEHVDIFLSPSFKLLWSAKTGRVMNGDTALKRTKVISLMHWEE